VPTYDVEKALGVVSPVSKQALLDLQADLAGGISAAPVGGFFRDWICCVSKE